MVNFVSNAKGYLFKKFKSNSLKMLLELSSIQTQLNDINNEI